MTPRWTKRLERLWARRPRLGRGTRTVINLAIIAVILLYVWGIAGYPLFFPTLEFRRLERQYLMPKSEIVFSATPSLFNKSVELELNGETVTLRDTWRVGASENWAAVMGYYRKYSDPELSSQVQQSINGKYLVRCTKTQSFSRPIVQSIHSGEKFLKSDFKEIAFLWEILSEQAIRVFIESTLPGRIRICKIDLGFQRFLNLSVREEFVAMIHRK